MCSPACAQRARTQRLAWGRTLLETTVVTDTAIARRDTHGRSRVANPVSIANLRECRLRSIPLVSNLRGAGLDPPGRRV
jgi:hypothetical protein